MLWIRFHLMKHLPDPFGDRLSISRPTDVRRRPIARACSECSAERRSAMVANRLYGLLFVLFSGLALGAPWPSAAQQATPPYGAPISLEQAKKIIAAAEAEAQKNNWPVV